MKKQNPAAVTCTVEPTGVYALAAAGAMLGLPRSCLPREVRLGRLRVSKRAGRYWVIGKWLLEWLEAGERRRRTSAPRIAEEA
jgi:hypothetical protein